MNKEKKSSNIRIIICAVIVVLIFLGFSLRLFDWQILNEDTYKEISAQSTSYTEVSDATRGEILDVNGKELAVNKTAYNIVLNKIYVVEDSTNDIINTLLDLCEICDIRNHRPHIHLHIQARIRRCERRHGYVRTCRSYRRS